MKLILLTNTGKCGTLFIQRLFDGHPFMVLLPFAFDYYFAWNKMRDDKDDLESFMNKLLEKTSLREVLHYVDRTHYLKRIRDHLPNDFVLENDRKELLEAMHLAYNFLLYKNKKVTHFLLNTINVNYLDQIKKDYPAHKHVFLIRDPKNSYASYVSSENSHDPEKKYQFLKNTLHNVVYSQIFFSNYPDQMKYLKIEELNADLVGEMKSLCKWLDINYSDCLLTETVNSFPYEEKKQGEIDRKKSAKFRNTRWVHSLSTMEITLLEFLNAELIDEYYDFASAKMMRKNYVARCLLFLPDWKHFFHENHDYREMAYYIVRCKWLTNRLNWLKLIRAVENKRNISL